LSFYSKFSIIEQQHWKAEKDAYPSIHFLYFTSFEFRNWTTSSRSWYGRV